MKNHQHYLAPLWLAVILTLFAPNLTFANGSNLTYAECVKRCNAENTTLLHKEMCRNACRANCDKAQAQFPERHTRIGNPYDENYGTGAISLPYGQVPGVRVYLFEGNDIIPCNDPTINWVIQSVSVVPTQAFVDNDFENVPWQDLTEIEPCNGLGYDAYFDPAPYGSNSFMLRTEVIDPVFGILEAYNSLDFSDAIYLNHSGNTHQSLGQANLVDNNGVLTVSNIGSSGDDGVTIDLGEATGLAVDFDVVLDNPGQELRLGLSGFVNDDPLGQALAELTIVPITNGGYANNVNFGTINPSSTTFEAYDASGSLVHSWIGESNYGWQSNYLPTSYNYCWWNSWYWPWRCYWGWNWWSWWYWRYWNWWYWPRYWYWGISYNVPTTITVNSPSGPLSISDVSEVRISIETDDTVTGGYQATINGTNINDFTLGNERLNGYGNFHQPLGEATVAANDGNLTVSNIGSSGQDGIHIELSDQAKEFQVNWEALIPTAQNSSLEFHSVFEDIPPIPVFFDYDGNQSVLGGDFGGRSPFGYNLNLYNDGQEVGAYDGLFNPLQLIVASSPVAVNVGTKDDLIYFDIYYEISSQATLVEQGANFPVTNVRIAIPTETAAGDIAAFTLLGRDLEAIDLNNEFAVTEQAASSNFDLKVFLGGAYDIGTGLHDANLRDQGLIPLEEPYSVLGSRVGAGGEFITADVLLTTGPKAVVDWVLIELRDANDPTEVIYDRAGLLLRDGNIVDLDGRSSIRFLGPLPEGLGTAHIAIRHRNHLGAMTANPVDLLQDTYIDYSNESYQIYGTDAQLELSPGVHGLIPGDSNGDGQVKYNGSNNDKNAILGSVGLFTPNGIIQNAYANDDINLDGQVKYNGANNDKNAILSIIGLFTPNDVKSEQLP